MKKMFFVMAALTAVCIGFAGCNQPNSSKPNNGGSNTPTVVQERDVYGSYWGSLEVAGAKFDMCMEIKKDFASIHSDEMGYSYDVITFTDNKDGTWLVGCYSKGEDTTKPSKHVRITVNTKKKPFSCKPYIVPMGDFTKFSDCIKGKPYDGSFKH